MDNLADLASRVMDMYYQQFKSDEDYFDLEDFMYIAGVAYSKILENAYDKARAETMGEEGMTQVNLFGDWVMKEKIEMKYDQTQLIYIGEIKTPIFTFPYDKYGYGIQDVRSKGSVDFIRSNFKTAWQLRRNPTNSKAYYYFDDNELFIKSSTCEIKEVTVYVVPEVTNDFFGSDGGPIPATKRFDIIDATLTIMKKARDGEVVDMTNNSNPNKVMQSEIDKAFNGLKTKPV